MITVANSPSPVLWEAIGTLETELWAQSIYLDEMARPVLIPGAHRLQAVEYWQSSIVPGGECGWAHINTSAFGVGYTATRWLFRNEPDELALADYTSLCYQTVGGVRHASARAGVMTGNESPTSYKPKVRVPVTESLLRRAFRELETQMERLV